jgi:diguanylate cyclase (GGDEF)-like protein
VESQRANARRTAVAFGSPATPIPQLGVARDRIGLPAAIGLALIFALVSAYALADGSGRTYEMHAFLPVCATIWATAELLTAFLLFAQYVVAGRLAYGLLGGAYALSGLLTIPYLAEFPNVFTNPPYSIGQLQASAWLYIALHCSYPLVIGLTLLTDPSLTSREVSRDRIPGVLAAIVGGAVTLAVGATWAIVANDDRLPVVVAPNGIFTHAYRSAVAPLAGLCNIFALLTLVRAGINVRPLSRLHVWIGLALVTTAFDGILSTFAPGRYSLAWYMGKFETITTASAVLIMLLCEVATLYRRLFDVASLDPLTGLANRRRLDEDIHALLRSRSAADRRLAMLVVDLDEFKAFNDRHGHLAGDEALRRVATVLRDVACRRHDVVARSGGEEFVIVLPDVSLDDARSIAERVCRSIEAADLGNVGGIPLRVTASVGIAYAADGSLMRPEELYERADRSLYAAKADGRNRVVMATATALRRAG